VPRIPLGQAIVRLPDRYYSPFLITFPPQPLKNTIVPDGVVRKRWELQAHAAPDPATPDDEAVQLGEKETTLLLDIVVQPISTITARYYRLGWNPKTGNDAKDALFQHGLVYFDGVVTPTGRIKILSLTKKGRERLQRDRHTLPAGRSSGATHEYWRHMIKERLSAQGYTVTEEHAIGDGRAADLRATKGQHEIFLEIETGNSDIASNIAKYNGLKGAVVFFFTTNALAQQHVARLTGEHRWWLTPTSMHHLDELLE